MTVQLDNSNPISWFISFLKMIRVDILDKFVIPGLGITYWDFIIGCAIAAVVITVLVNSVRIGVVSYSKSKSNARSDEGDGK